jgi:hypothetical protein
MPMSSSEARETLQALDDLISVAEALNLESGPQRAALNALHARREVLAHLLAARQELKAQKVIGLDAWRDGSDRATAPSRRRRGAVAVAALRL